MSELTMSQFSNKDDLYSAMQARVIKLEAQLAIAVEALEFYDPKDKELGNTATEALNKIKKLGEKSNG
jgi:phage tail sheath protein FI